MLKKCLTTAPHPVGESVAEFKLCHIVIILK